MKIYNNRGFTLAELFVASSILVFVLASLLTLFINCLFLNENNRNRSIAVGHAEYVLESIKNSSFTEINASIRNGTWNWSSSVIESKGLRPLRSESINTTVSGSNPLDVVVIAQWRSKGQTSGYRNTTLETLFTEIK